jgi:hypothetical protein
MTVPQSHVYGALAAQEFEIGLTIQNIKLSIAAINRLRQIYEMVKINIEPMLRGTGHTPQDREGMVRSIRFAEAEEKRGELQERMRIDFLQKQLAVQTKNLAMLRKQADVLTRQTRKVL